MLFFAALMASSDDIECSAVMIDKKLLVGVIITSIHSRRRKKGSFQNLQAKAQNQKPSSRNPNLPTHPNSLTTTALTPKRTPSPLFPALQSRHSPTTAVNRMFHESAAWAIPVRSTLKIFGSAIKRKRRDTPRSWGKATEFRREFRFQPTFFLFVRRSSTNINIYVGTDTLIVMSCDLCLVGTGPWITLGCPNRIYQTNQGIPFHVEKRPSLDFEFNTWTSQRFGRKLSKNKKPWSVIHSNFYGEKSWKCLSNAIPQQRPTLTLIYR